MSKRPRRHSLAMALPIFYDDKGVTKPADIRQWCAPTVLLLEIAKRIWKSDELLEAAALIHHSGQEEKLRLTLRWTLATLDGRELTSGTLPAVTMQPGMVSRAGDIRTGLSGIAAPAELRLTLEAIERQDIRNSYPLWVFPAASNDTVPPNVLITDDWKAAKSALLVGGRVVFFADRVGAAGSGALASWRPLFWSSPLFPGQQSQTMGLLVRKQHPAFSGFPTPAFSDWLWHDICAGAKGFNLTGLVPADWKPIAQPVDDFHLNRKLGSIFCWDPFSNAAREQACCWFPDTRCRLIAPRAIRKSPGCDATRPCQRGRVGMARPLVAARLFREAHTAWP